MNVKLERTTPSTRPHGTPDPRLVALVLLALSALALYLRLPGALDWPLWYDEAETWHASRAPLLELLQWRAHPYHPPFSFAVVRLFTEIVGTQSEWALRSVSLASGVLAVPAAYLMGRMGISHRVGLGCAALISVHPEFVLQGQTARMYSILAFLMILAFVLVLDLDRRDRPSPWRWIGLGVVLAAASATHYLGFALWAGLAVAVVDRARRLGREERHAFARGFGISSLVLGALLVPGAPRLWDHLGYPVGMIGALLDGSAISDFQSLPIPPLPERYLPVVALLLLALLALLLLGIAGLVLVARRSRFFATLLVAVALLSLPVVLFASAILVGGLGRYLVPVSLVWMVGFSTLAFESDRRWASVLGIVVILLFTLASITIPRPVLFDTGEMMERVARERSLHRTSVLFHPCRMGLLGSYYGLRPNPRPETGWNDACPWEPGDPLPHPTTWLVLGDAFPGDERLHAVVTDLAERYEVDFEAADLDRLLSSYTTAAVRFEPHDHRVLLPDRAFWPEGVWSSSVPERRDATDP